MMSLTTNLHRPCVVALAFLQILLILVMANCDGAKPTDPGTTDPDQRTQRVTRDVDFRRGTYFFIDPSYRENFSWRDPNGLHLASVDSIEIIRVFVANRTSYQDPTHIRKAVAYLHPPVSVDGGIPSSPDSSEIERGDYRELQSNEFSVDRDLGYIVLSTPMQRSDALGVFYVTRNRFIARTVQYGEVPSDQNSEILLRLLKRRDELPPVGNDPATWGTWQYEWRNVYFLGKTEIDPDGFELKISRKASDGEVVYMDGNGIPYIQLLGLDRRGENPDTPPDGLVDIDQELIDFQRGELIFPDLYPFASSLLINVGGMAFPSTQQSGLSDQTPALYVSGSSAINSNISTVPKYTLHVSYNQEVME